MMDNDAGGGRDGEREKWCDCTLCRNVLGPLFLFFSSSFLKPQWMTEWHFNPFTLSSLWNTDSSFWKAVDHVHHKRKLKSHCQTSWLFTDDLISSARPSVLSSNPGKAALPDYRTFAVTTPTGGIIMRLGDLFLNEHWPNILGGRSWNLVKINSDKELLFAGEGGQSLRGRGDWISKRSRVYLIIV